MASKEGKQCSKGDLAKRVVLVFAIWAAIGLGIRLVMGVLAAEPATTSFTQTWGRTDDPVAFGLVTRTWMWGPDGFTAAMTEPYTESPGGERTVQYFDKSRMEDNGFRATLPWDVTNGLLVVELVTGRMQMGDNDFVQHTPATANVAGDQDVTSVQYATLASLLTAPALPDGATITQRIDQSGYVSDAPSLASHGVTAAYRVTVPGIEHQVASPFWTFMNSIGTVYEGGSYLDAPLFLSPFYATGYPITEAYWANVKVAGIYQDVLLQCFERRCLTYTPGNAPGWQVEAGNVGQHYYTWRYGQDQPDPIATAPPTGTPEPSVTEPPASGTLPAASPTAEPTAQPPTATVESSPSPTVEPSPTPTATEETYSYLGQWGGPLELSLPFDGAQGVDTSQDGYVYITDSVEDRVMKFGPNGEFVMMWGRPGISNGEFADPTDVAVDRLGNVFVLETRNNRVQKFTSDGIHQTTWGTRDRTGSSIEGEFDAPRGIAVDSAGNVYVTDEGNRRVQKFDNKGNFIETWVVDQTGLALFNLPEGIDIDDNDVVYVGEYFECRITVFNTDGMALRKIGTNADGGSCDQRDNGIAVSPDGLVYVVDSENDRVQAFKSNGAPAGSWGVSGDGPGEFEEPKDVAIGVDGALYVTDSDNGRVQRFDLRGNYLDSWEDGRRGRFGLGAIAMALDPDGNVYVSDFGRIQKFAADGRFLREIGAEIGPGKLDTPYAFAAGPDGRLYVADFERNVVTIFTQDGQYVGEWNGNVRPDGELDGPMGLALDDDGYVYVLEIFNHRIQKFQPDGGFEAEWDLTGVAETPLDIAISGDRLYLLDAGAGFMISGSPLPIVTPGTNPSVKVFDLSAGSLLGEFDGDGRLIAPYGIDIDAAGDVYLSDVGTNTVFKFKPNGGFLTEIGEPGGGNGQFAFPTDVKIASDGRLYVLDTLNYRVQMFK